MKTIELPEPAMKLHGKRGREMSPETMPWFTTDQMRNHAEAVRLATIEECAKVCNQMQTNVPFDEIEDVERGFNASLRRAVNAIRALGKSK